MKTTFASRKETLPLKNIAKLIDAPRSRRTLQFYDKSSA